MDFMQIGKIMLLFGGTLLLTGLVFIFFSKFTSIGRLPGDIVISKKDFTFYFPVATCILISIILTLLFNLFTSGK